MSDDNGIRFEMPPDYSAARKAFCKALAQAQAKIEGAIKDKTNPGYKSKYADLGAVWDACREPLTSNGLAILQFPDYDPETKCVSIDTIVTHADGYEKASRLRIPVSKTDAQGIGSAITYGRRYSLMAAVGIAPEDDDGAAAVAQANGNGAQKRTPGARANGQPTAAASKPQWAGFVAKLHSFSDPDECAVWFDDPGTQDKINSWPKGDAGDWAELASEEYDRHMQALYNTNKVLS